MFRRRLLRNDHEYHYHMDQSIWLVSFNDRRTALQKCYSKRLTGLVWNQFSGSVVSVGAYSGNPDGAPGSKRNPYSGVGANVLGPGSQLIRTTGTILVLNFADVIQLTEDFYAPGSLSSFNLQLCSEQQRYSLGCEPG